MIVFSLVALHMRNRVLYSKVDRARFLTGSGVSLHLSESETVALTRGDSFSNSTGAAPVTQTRPSFLNRLRASAGPVVTVSSS